MFNALMVVAVVGLGLVGLAWLLAYGARTVGAAVFEEMKDADDHEHSLSVARARRCEGVEPARASGGASALSPLSAAESRYAGERDPTIGVDVARAEVRERVRRYNQREVRR